MQFDCWAAGVDDHGVGGHVGKTGVAEVEQQLPVVGGFNRHAQPGVGAGVDGEAFLHTGDQVR
jgi:hypothetical protein